MQLATSTIRFGAGVSREVGMDLVNMKAKNVLVFTDQNVRQNYKLKKWL